MRRSNEKCCAAISSEVSGRSGQSRNFRRVTKLNKWDPNIYRRVWISTLLLPVALAGCQRKNPSVDNGYPDGRQLLRRAIGGEPSSLDPGKAVDTYSFEVIRDLYEGLVTESASGEVQPGVASSWRVSPSGKEYTFELRATARWSNGSPIRAQDFVSEWRRVVDPKEASPVADLLRPIANAAEIIDGKLPPDKLGAYATAEGRLVVNLTEPAPYFLQLLCHSATFPVLLPKESGQTGKDWVSNGPYVLLNWTPGASLRLEKNPQYWDHDHVKIPKIEYIPIADANSEIARYRAGQLDVTDNVPPSALPLVKRDFPNELLVAHFLGTVYYALNLHSSRPFGDLQVRQALAMSIDRIVLTNTVLNFGQTPAFGFVPPGTWNYDQQTWTWQSMSNENRIAEARRLYAAAGYSSMNPLRLKILFNANPEVKKLSVAIASMWKEQLGIDAELVEEEYRVFLDSRRNTSRWNVARLSWVADYNDAGDFLDIFRRGSANNDSGYSDTKFDSLLDEAAVTPDPSSRKILLEKAEARMLSDYPVIPIYFYSSKRLIKPYIRGAEANPLNRLYSKHLSIDQLQAASRDKQI